MKGNIISLSTILFMIINTNLINAQTPTLNVNGQKTSEVYLKDLDVKVDIVGTISTTTLTMTFKNRTNKILEGELTFPLPDGVTVSGYALDINGKMRKAVPVDKSKGTQVFEEIERRRVDPGLLERVEGNNFRTRIYPINGNSQRTVSITYEEDLPVVNNKAAYRLPMDYSEAIDNFSLKATVWQNAQKPEVQGGMANDIKFDKQQNAYVSTFQKNNYTPAKLLSFSLPISDAPQTLMQSASGSHYFLASYTPKQQSRPKVWANSIGVIWDVSLSAKDRNIEEELKVLETIVANKKNLKITLGLLNNTFNNVGTFEIKNGDWSTLQNYLKNINYDGGTDYSQISLKKISSDEYILFSDGLSTLSDADFTLKKEGENAYLNYFTKANKNAVVHTVVSSAKADYSSLKWIASQTKAKFINLNSSTPAEVQNELLNETLEFIGIKENNLLSEVYPSVATPIKNKFSIAGISGTEKTNIVLQFGYGDKVIEEKIIELDAKKNMANDLDIYKLWAQKKIAELDLQFEKNKEDLQDLAEQFGIVTRGTSLIVLETLEDYIQYGITPPDELKDQYSLIVKGRQKEQLQRVNNLLANSQEVLKELKGWWDTDFKVKQDKFPKPDSNTSNYNIADDIIAEDPVEIITEESAMESLVMRDEVTMDEKMVVNQSSMVSNRVRKNASTKDGNTSNESTKRYVAQQGKITLAEIKQDSEYMKGLTGDLVKDYATYLKQREVYGTTPTFYFDMANWFYTKGNKEKALTILTSVAELNIENAGLFRLLAYRLKEYKEYNLETYICKKVVDWRPMDPQSYRDYALALSDAGKYQEALNTLYSVLTQNFASSVQMISVGIDEVVITELNQLIAMQKVKTNDIDKNLITAMPVDIRVVINWNMPNTDIDLHVTDPLNETCYYGNSRTKAGGRISRDITRGLGPEQFMLKKAIKGKYQVKINYFGDSQVKAEGPATIMAEIYTNYSDKTEKREVVCIQLSKENKGQVQIAEFTF